MQSSRPIEQRLKRAVSLIITSGYQIDPPALDFLRALAQEGEIEGHVKGMIDKASNLSERPLFITKDMLKESLGGPLKKEGKTVVDGFGGTFHPYANEIDAKVEVLENATRGGGSAGTMEDSLEYFRDRLKKIERIFKERLDVREAASINTALEVPQNSKVKIIGIVTEKRETKRGIFIRLEDYENYVAIFVPSNVKREVLEKAQRVLLDQVICVEAVKGRNDLLIANNLINPEIPERKLKTAADSVYAAMISDLHVGSREFLEEAFNRFIQWLRGKNGNNKQREIAGRVKYVVIAGDIVDGIGIYPNQEKDLIIKDVYEQYRVAAEFIKKIPEYIEVIIIPGNHDATRQALPQPAILRDYAEPIYEARKVIMLGNPAKIRLHGVNFLLYHGRSLDDVIRVVPEVTYQNLEKHVSTAMKQLLKVRHLAPIYGAKTPIAPIPYDSLVIDVPPDVFHAGHIHVMGYEMYRGTLIINSGAWQSKTEFQERMGLSPTPGIAPIIDLKTFNVMPINFIS